MHKVSDSGGASHAGDTRKPVRLFASRLGLPDRGLKSIEFVARAGECVTIVAEPGAGKTSLIALLALQAPAGAGELRLLDVATSDLSLEARAELKRRMGVIAEEPTLLGHLSAAENVALALNAAGKPAPTAADITELFAFLGLAGQESTPAARLSLSARRRVASARAVAHRPEIVLADEPLAGLSADHAERVVRLLAQIVRGGAALVAATSDETLAQRLPGPCLHLANGRLEGAMP